MLCLLVPFFTFAQISSINPSFAKESAPTNVQILGTFNPSGVTTVSLLQNGLPVPATCTVTNVIPTKVSVNITLPACGQGNQGNYYDIVINNNGTIHTATNSFTPVCQCQAVIQANIFQDNNNDGIDNGLSDPPLGNVMVQATNTSTNTTYIGYTRPNGVLVIAIPIPQQALQENYTLSVPSMNNPALQNMTLSTPTNAFNLSVRKIQCPYPGMAAVYNNNFIFGYHPSSNANDLALSVGSIVVQPDIRPAGYPTTIPNAVSCGMATNSMFGLMTLTYTNNGTVATAGTIHFDKPPLTGGPYNWHTFSYCYVNGAGCTPSVWYTPHTILENGVSVSLSNVSNNTCSGLDYTFASLAPGQSRTMTMIFEPYAEFASVSQWFYNVNVTATVASSPLVPDATPNDNTCTTLLCLPYDPNSKEVSPKGIGAEGCIPNGQELTYTIHFQNVGTAPAHHVRVEDLIDEDLDLSTIEILSRSHPVELDAVNNNLIFFFRDINLPDSMSNPLGSQGFVKFRIHPKSNLVNGTQLKNHADIYFDFMPAIVTNEVLNTIGDCRKSDTHASTTVDANVLTNESTMTTTGTADALTQGSFSIYPNPAQDQIEIAFATTLKNDTKLEIFDAAGKMVKQITIAPNTLHTKVSISDLENGLYFCKTATHSFPLSIQR